MNPYDPTKEHTGDPPIVYRGPRFRWQTVLGCAGGALIGWMLHVLFPIIELKGAVIICGFFGAFSTWLTLFCCYWIAWGKDLSAHLQQQDLLRAKRKGPIDWSDSD
jgi:hypothetical protein